MQGLGGQAGHFQPFPTDTPRSQEWVGTQNTGSHKEPTSPPWGVGTQFHRPPCIWGGGAKHCCRSKPRSDSLLRVSGLSKAEAEAAGTAVRRTFATDPSHAATAWPACRAGHPQGRLRSTARVSARTGEEGEVWNDKLINKLSDWFPKMSFSKIQFFHLRLFLNKEKMLFAFLLSSFMGKIIRLGSIGGEN